MYEIAIKPKREQIFIKHNSRVYSGAIASVQPAFTEAGMARVTSFQGAFIAWGWYDEASFTSLHLLSWDEETVPDDAWLEKTIASAIDRRKNIEGTDAMRLIHGEADFIPGLAVDRYADVLSAIISQRYAQDHLETIIRTLLKETGAKRIAVTVDASHAKLEGLKRKERLFTPDGEIPFTDAEATLFQESGIWYSIDGGISQKSGFYCDQRDNRNIVEGYAKGARVLDACSFTGAFTLHCLRGGAESVLSVDASESVLRHLLYQVHINEDRGAIPEGSRERVTIKKDDVFSLLRSLEKDSFDLVVLDPPKLSPHKGKEEQALLGYKDLNLQAMRVVKNGGILATFSCSGSISRDDFRTAVSYAAADAGVDVQILHQLSAGADHPVRVSLPETEYLKGLVLRIVKK